MELNKAKIRIKELKILINKWSIEYYRNNQSKIDDSVYDLYLQELFKLEESFPDLKSQDSPTQNIGSFKETIFKKSKHDIPMQSLKNAFSYEDLMEFDKKIKSISKEYSFFVEPKIDGLSISLHYKNGLLQKAITRGDGDIGEDVTNNVFQIINIPKKINIKDSIEVRGEIFIPLTEFKRINIARELSGEKIFSNPRNAASGTMRQLSPKIVFKRKLDAIMYWCADSETKKYKWDTQLETIKNISNLGFKTSSISRKSMDIEGVFTVIENISDKRLRLDYEIDGIVVKINETCFYDKIGFTSKFPKWAIAYKFPTITKETTLLSIFPTIGRTGRVTYNAELSPIKISGTIIKKATLHNADYIKDLDLRIGDIVKIKKAGEIIPKVISFNRKKRNLNSVKWEEEILCPSCKLKLVRIQGEVDQYCLNPNCNSRIKESIIHFCSRDAMNIEGLSVKQIERFVDLKIVKNFEDIYDLYKKEEYLIELDGYQKKSVRTLINNIEKSKDNNLDKFIFALGIRHIGKKTSRDLANIFLNINKIQNISYEELNCERDFGEVKSQSLVEYFNDEVNILLIQNLLLKGLNMKQKNISINVKNKFNEKTIVITGSFNGLKREEVKDYFYSLGAKITTTMTSNTDFLIFGLKGSENKADKIDKDKIIKIKNIEELGV